MRFLSTRMTILLTLSKKIFRMNKYSDRILCCCTHTLTRFFVLLREQWRFVKAIIVWIIEIFRRVSMKRLWIWGERNWELKTIGWMWAFMNGDFLIYIFQIRYVKFKILNYFSNETLSKMNLLFLSKTFILKN